MAAAQATETDLQELVAHYRSAYGDYARDILQINTKAAVLQPFVMNRAQKIVHHTITTQLRETKRVRVIVLKARQEGISTYTAGRFFRRTTLYENQNALVIADQRKRGAVLFQIYERFDKKQPVWIAPRKRWQRKGWSLTYDTPEGKGLNSQLTVETAKDAAAGRGSTIQAVHASELGFWENPEEVWTALMQAVPDEGSEVIVESTANGVGNMFHQMWEDAEAGDSSFIPIFLPWWIHEEYVKLLTPAEKVELAEDLSEWELKATTTGFECSVAISNAIDAGIIDLELSEEGRYRVSLEQIAWRRATIKDKLNNDENLFKQEYPSTAREAFLVSGNCFFDEDALLDYEEKVTPPERYTMGWVKSVALRTKASRGELRVWTDPRRMDPGKPKDEANVDGEYVIFADTATGRMAGEREAIYSADREQGGRDFSAAWVYDVKARAYVALLHGRTIPPETFAEKLYALGFMYALKSRRTGNLIPALIGVERNHSSGETVARKLRDLGYPNLYFDRQINVRRTKMLPAVGWVTTEAKRVIMLDEFSAEIRAGTVALPDADTIRECFTFIRDESGRAEAQEGCHDDRVIAAAGCIQMARHHRAPGVAYDRTPVRRGGPVGRLEYEEVADGRSERDRRARGERRA